MMYKERIRERSSRDVSQEAFTPAANSPVVWTGGGDGGALVINNLPPHIWRVSRRLATHASPAAREKSCDLTKRGNPLRNMFCCGVKVSTLLLSTSISIYRYPTEYYPAGKKPEMMSETNNSSL